MEHHFIKLSLQIMKINSIRVQKGQRKSKINLNKNYLIETERKLFIYFSFVEKWLVN